MKPEINKKDYSSYRVPYIEEFIDGFEYEYVNWSLVHDTKIPIEGLCKCIVGNSILQARILNVNNPNKTVHVKFLEKGYNDYYMKVMGYDFDLATNEDKKFPIELLYNYKGYEEPYEFFKSTQKHWRKGIWKSAWGYSRKDDLLKALKKGNIIAKGKNSIYTKATHDWEDDWLSVWYNSNKIETKNLNTHTKEWKFPDHLKCYSLLYKDKHNIMCAEHFLREDSIIPFILEHKNNISKILKCFKRLDKYLDPYHSLHTQTISGKQIEKEILKEQIKEAMSTKQMRTHLLDGYVLCFMFNSLNVEVHPPINSSKHTYDFSQSIFINGKPLNSLNIKSKEYIEWSQCGSNSQFKKHLYELISPNINTIFSKDDEKELTKHIYNIRATKENETHFYTVSYIIDKEPTKIQIEVLREWTEARAETAIMQKVGCYPSNILNIEKHGT